MRGGTLSTHDLTQRSTEHLQMQDEKIDTFNSRPHAEVDKLRIMVMKSCCSFNSRPHAEVDQYGTLWRCVKGSFQLTTSRRGRPFHPRGAPQHTHSFNSRPHAEVDRPHKNRLTHGILSTHDLTQRSTLTWITNDDLSESFNSRPHAEVDKHQKTIMLKEETLSTHDLTQRSTFYRGGRSGCKYLSTHDLTQRSTFLRIFVMRLVSLSTHDLTQRSTFWLYVCIPCIRSFNSRPHAEVDPRRSTGTPSSVSFNSRPHAEVDATC